MIFRSSRSSPACNDDAQINIYICHDLKPSILHTLITPDLSPDATHDEYGVSTMIRALIAS
jgi:hypothetical protein